MIHQLLTGSEFNLIQTGKIVKLTNQSENHNEFHFKTGLNIDSIPFNPKGNCQSGGIYFCSIDNLFKWLNYSDQSMIYVRSVIIPDDALVWIEEDKFKTDRLILGEKMLIEDMDIWNDLEYCLKAIKYDYTIIEYMKKTDVGRVLQSILYNCDAFKIPKLILNLNDIID